jgi:hypothetical protein
LAFTGGCFCMKYDRKRLLNMLLSVEPGSTSKEVTEQSNHVVMRKGRFYTLSRETACSIPSGLPQDMEGSVELKLLASLLKEMPEDEIEIETVQGVLKVKGKGRAAKLPMPEEVKLPVGDVTLPGPQDWQSITQEFTSAVLLAQGCTKRKDKAFLKECVHLHPDFVEGSDSVRMLRYTIATFVKQPVLVRGVSIKAITPFSFTKAAETDDWLHFRNPLGLRLSVRKLNEVNYPDFTQILEMRGEPIVLPKGVAAAAKIAGSFAGEDGNVHITLENGLLLVLGTNGSSEYEEKRKTEYTGSKLKFSLPPKMIEEIVTLSSRCELGKSSLRIDGKGFVYCCATK